LVFDSEWRLGAVMDDTITWNLTTNASYSSASPYGSQCFVSSLMNFQPEGMEGLGTIRIQGFFFALLVI
jgi:hypothetical protein